MADRSRYTVRTLRGFSPIELAVALAVALVGLTYRPTLSFFSSSKQEQPAVTQVRLADHFRILTAHAAPMHIPTRLIQVTIAE
jgi:hypothetical protein